MHLRFTSVHRIEFFQNSATYKFLKKFFVCFEKANITNSLIILDRNVTAPSCHFSSSAFKLDGRCEIDACTDLLAQSCRQNMERVNNARLCHDYMEIKYISNPSYQLDENYVVI